jgi:macrolide transport system ATP-binding/permease protein
VRLFRLLYTIPLRCRSLFRRDRVEQDLEDEFRDHLERQIEANVASGMTRDEARYASQRAFGGLDQRKEECRDMRHVNLVDHGIQDLRFALRQLLRHRAFAGTAVVVLSLGIAGSIAIFGFVDSALIKPLPYRDPSRLVTVFSARPDLAQGQTRGSVSYLDFIDWRSRNRAFDSSAAYDVRGGFTLTTSSGPEQVSGLRVTSGFFRTLGVTPALGREFLASEEGRSAPPAVVLSFSAWQRRFGGSPDILGRTVTLQSPWLADAEPHVVIGVLPPDFHFALAEHAEFWATIRGPQACWNIRGCRSLQAVARLADDVSIQMATAEMTSVIEQLQAEYPDAHRHQEIGKLVPLRDVVLGNVRPMLLMLLSGAALLLVIACMNVASLLLARSESRTQEIAVRRVLGASSVRLVRQFATEAFVLAATGAVFGVVLASWGMQFLMGLLSADMISRMPYLQAVGLNFRLVSLACVVSLIAALAFALTPVVRMPIFETRARLNEGSRTSAGLQWRRLGAHLVVAELAIAVVLLVSAGLLGRSLFHLLHVDAGFNVRGLATASVTPVSVRARGTGAAADAPDASNVERPGALARRVAERLAALPGVDAVGYADLLPLGPGLAPSSTFWVLGRADGDQLKEDWPVRRVSAEYFNALQAMLVRGRYFTEDEVALVRPVMIINETAARRYFAGDDPVGRWIAFGSAASPAREIVGIVADIKDGPPETPAHPSAYVPFDQTGFALVIRTRQDQPALGPALVAAVAEIRPDALVGGVTTMTERVNRLPSTSLQRSSAWLVGGFAAMAFVLSLVGLYGVIAYSVGQRTREIGVRMALGAQRTSVYRLVLGEATWLIGTGTALGIICAVIAGILMRRLLFGVQWWDPPTLVATVFVLAISALVASYIAARRAASVNPIEVLRAE